MDLDYLFALRTYYQDNYEDESDIINYLRNDIIREKLFARKIIGRIIDIRFITNEISWLTYSKDQTVSISFSLVTIHTAISSNISIHFLMRKRKSALNPVILCFFQLMLF